MNITLLTVQAVHQSADFLLWDPDARAVVSDSSAKTVEVGTFDWRVTITYTGIGHWSGADTADWVVQLARGVVLAQARHLQADRTNGDTGRDSSLIRAAPDHSAAPSHLAGLRLEDRYGVEASSWVRMSCPPLLRVSLPCSSGNASTPPSA
jgi:hypothetical protein